MISYNSDNWHGKMLFEVYILSSGRISAKYFMVSPSYVPDLDLLFLAGMTLA